MSTRRGFLFGLGAAIAAAAVTKPVAALKAMTRSSVPGHPGWVFADGSTCLRSAYPELAALLGSRWGDGQGRFTIPDMRGFVRPADMSPHSHSSLAEYIGPHIPVDGGSNSVLTDYIIRAKPGRDVPVGTVMMVLRP